MHELIHLFIRLLALGFTGRCDICDAPFHRTRYKWNIRGKKAYLCPNCNGRLERQQSKLAFDPDAEINIPQIRERPRQTGGSGVLLLLLVAGIGCFLWYSGKENDSPNRNTVAPSATPIPRQPIPSSIASPSVAQVHQTPMTPKPLPRDVTLISPIQMPILVRGIQSGTITLQRGTRVQLVSVAKDSLVIRYLDSKATIPVNATDLRLLTAP